jgi:hypothetical protein
MNVSRILMSFIAFLCVAPFLLALVARYPPSRVLVARDRAERTLMDPDNGAE